MLKITAKLLNITDTKIEQYPGDDSGNSIVVTGEGMAGKGETSQNYGLSGIISNPPNDDKTLVLTIGNLDISLGSINYQVDLPANRGETKVYSTDESGVEKASLLLNSDEEHVINNGTDYAVAFEDLKTEFNELNDKYNKLITTLNAWTPVPNDGGAALKTALTSASPLDSTANIDNSKVEKVRLP